MIVKISPHRFKDDDGLGPSEEVKRQLNKIRRQHEREFGVPFVLASTRRERLYWVFELLPANDEGGSS